MPVTPPPLFRPGDRDLWASILRIDREDFDILHLKHPCCGDFETLNDWYRYFYRDLHDIDRTTIFINEFNASAREYIQEHAAIARGERK